VAAASAGPYANLHLAQTDNHANSPPQQRTVLIMFPLTIIIAQMLSTGGGVI